MGEGAIQKTTVLPHCNSCLTNTNMPNPDAGMQKAVLSGE